MTAPAPTPGQLCAACGYDLRGIRAGKCPECGTVQVPPGSGHATAWTIATLMLAGVFGNIVLAILITLAIEGRSTVVDTLLLLPIVISGTLGACAAEPILRTPAASRSTTPVPGRIVVLLVLAIACVNAAILLRVLMTMW